MFCACIMLLLFSLPLSLLLQQGYQQQPQGGYPAYPSYPSQAPPPPQQGYKQPQYGASQGYPGAPQQMTRY